MSVGRSGPSNDEELLEYLRQFLSKHGKLTERLISSAWDMPCAQMYNQRFGGLTEAYKRIGYKPVRNLAHVERDRGLTAIRRAFIANVVDELVGLGATVRQDARTKLLLVNGHLRMRLIISPCRTQIGRASCRERV